ncbi:hypothetical protein [Dechloromonas sp. H13]|uniref:hypothetical protein n=1 Tax=Dechloromonas sp. H13 TaxID=2570193 RepID=UPI001290F7F9|nr:hypothetical protein [Dechloromonas sp. H13]
MKLLFALILAVALTACSSTGGKQPPAAPERSGRQDGGAIPLAESAFQESSGTLNLMFDAKGNWVRITALGTASLTEDSPGARETALMIASMRAKRTVAEFLSSDVRTSKTLTRIARSYGKTFQSSEAQSADGTGAEDGEAADGGSEGNSVRSEKARQAHRIASVLTERIHDSSSAILKGIYVTRRSFDDASVSVELTASRESIGAARQVSRMMGGALQ